MIPLLVILMITGFSILTSCHFTPNVTWFTYYVGAVIGIFVSGMVLEFWNKGSDPRGAGFGLTPGRG